MNTTRVFSETLKAYYQGYRIIANRGGTRSSKTFSELQLINLIMQHSKKRRVITTVSHKLPHLEGGAIRDFDNILLSDGLIVDDVRTKRPYIYTINNSIHEFVGFDKPGKALGAARAILFVNEANKMPHSIVHQLFQRTEEVIFLDWNPSEDFWFDDEGYANRSDCYVINSNFIDNIDPTTGKSNLSKGQLNELLIAQQKAEEEEAKGIYGYWWNWWQVYGLGLKGKLEGVIFPTWNKYDNLPGDCDLFRIYGLDWGGNDPTALIEMNIDFDNKRLYLKQKVYQPQILNSRLIETIHNINQNNDMVICDSARKDKIFELQMAGINAHKCKKYPGVKLDNIDNLREFLIFVHEDSEDLQIELNKYKWAKDKMTGKSLNVPEDGNDHGLDASGYALEFYKRNIRTF